MKDERRISCFRREAGAEQGKDLFSRIYISLHVRVPLLRVYLTHTYAIRRTHWHERYDTRLCIYTAGTIQNTG